MVTSSVIEVGFVNNMPDAAFVETERQFLALLGGRAAGVVVRRYAAASRWDSAALAPHLQDGYKTIDHLLTTSPDGLVVTGSEPAGAELRGDPLWPQFVGLVDWAVARTSGLWLACLAAHAALCHLDGIERRPLPAKCSGVWPQHVDRRHPLAAGLPPHVALPHSRLNDVPTAEVAAAGYRVVASSPETGWSVAAGRRGDCTMVLVQGHPEYDATSLLREYRRDVRRYLKCERDDYPPLPAPYLDDEAVERFGAFRQRASAVHRPDARIMEDFPYDEVAGGLRAPWEAVAARLGANWLAGIRHGVVGAAS
ncbi:MAG: homoserine O-acetyltransferase/O-succinyltransferase family protein [Acidimicrobiales bacterium]